MISTSAIGTFETCPPTVESPFIGVDRKWLAEVRTTRLTHYGHLASSAIEATSYASYQKLRCGTAPMQPQRAAQPTPSGPPPTADPNCNCPAYGRWCDFRSIRSQRKVASPRRSPGAPFEGEVIRLVVNTFRCSNPKVVQQLGGLIEWPRFR